MASINHLPRLLLIAEIQGMIDVLRETARHALNSQELPETLFHYTTQNGLQGIIESSTFYFSAMHMLNDASEVSYMWNLLQEQKELLIKEKEKDYAYGEFVEGFYRYAENEELCKEIFLNHNMPDFLNIYSVSFSVNGDSLHQWQGYTKSDGVGCNISFSEDELRRSFSEKVKDLARNNSEFMSELERRNKKIEDYCPLFFHGSMIYEEVKQVNAIKRLFVEFGEFYQREENRIAFEMGQKNGIMKDLDYDSFIYLHLFQGLMILMVFIKNPAFSQEEEYRIALFDYADAHEENKFPKLWKVEHRSKNSSDIPFVRIPYDKRTIKKVVVSPYHGDTKSINQIERILSSNGIHPSIERSNIPLRY